MESPQIAKTLKSSPYYIKRLHNQARRFNLEELKKALLMMYDADVTMKSGFDGNVEVSLLDSELMM